MELTPKWKKNFQYKKLIIEIDNGSTLIMFLLGSRFHKVENIPVRGKISEVNSCFKRHLQDKSMQEISETMNNGLRKVCTTLGSGITN